MDAHAKKNCRHQRWQDEKKEHEQRTSKNKLVITKGSKLEQSKDQEVGELFGGYHRRYAAVR